MKRFWTYFLHFLQVLLLASSYYVQDLYQNHLGFMRNIAFFSKKFVESSYDSFLTGLAVLLLVVAIYWVVKAANLERILLLIFSGCLVVWQLFFSLAQVPIYYLISGILFLIVLLQMILAKMKGVKDEVC